FLSYIVGVKDGGRIRSTTYGKNRCDIARTCRAMSHRILPYVVDLIRPPSFTPTMYDIYSMELNARSRGFGVCPRAEARVSARCHAPSFPRGPPERWRRASCIGRVRASASAG